jgi:D-methionine transport system substrate-binding protein
MMTVFNKTFWYAVLSLLCVVSLTACENHSTNKANDTVVVGTISGPETELMTVAKKVAKKKFNLNIKIVEFSDYALPNAALNDGSLDANAFQHEPFLTSEMKNKGYKLAIIAKTFVYPMAIYSSKIKKISEIPAKGIVAIPNDASNEARALILLSKAKLINLNPGIDVTATPHDILANPLNLQFKELDAAQLPRVLPDVSIAVINTNYAIPAGLYPSKDAIFIEDKTSPYVNLIVARADKVHDPRLQKLVESFQSPEVLEKAKELFKGQAVQGW